jgi:hypothetical protein
MKTQGIIDHSIHYTGYLSTSGQDNRTCIDLFSFYFTVIIDIFCLFLPYI